MQSGTIGAVLHMLLEPKLETCLGPAEEVLLVHPFDDIAGYWLGTVPVTRRHREFRTGGRDIITPLAHIECTRMAALRRLQQ